MVVQQYLTDKRYFNGMTNTRQFSLIYYLFLVSLCSNREERLFFGEVLNRRVALSCVSALFFVQKREAEGRKRKGRFEADYLQRRDTWSGGLVCEKTEG